MYDYVRLRKDAGVTQIKPCLLFDGHGVLEIRDTKIIE